MTPGKAAGCGLAFFGVFLVAGLGFSAFFIWPAFRVLESRSWHEVPCEVLESRVATHPGDESDTYSVEVRYRYTVDGRDYTSDRYHFFVGSTSGYEGKARVVERLPPGTRTVCWVDPDDPSEAVLERRFTLEYLFGLIPLVFVAVGAGGIVMTLMGTRRLTVRRAVGRPDRLPESDADPAAEASGGADPGLTAAAAHRSGDGAPRVLESRMSPGGKLGCAVLVALFWNGIVGAFVWRLWEGWRAGSPDGRLALLLVPFVLVGALFLIGVPYQLLALFNPRPRVVLTPGTLAPGEPARLTWRFRGWPERIRRLRITLEGSEEAEPGHGDSRRTRRETFASYELLDTSLGLEIAGGSTRLSIPADARPTSEGPGSRIVWTLKVRGEIRLWPDVSEELEIPLHPSQRR